MNFLLVSLIVTVIHNLPQIQHCIFCSSVVADHFHLLDFPLLQLTLNFRLILEGARALNGRGLFIKCFQLDSHVGRRMGCPTLVELGIS